MKVGGETNNQFCLSLCLDIICANSQFKSEGIQGQSTLTMIFNLRIMGYKQISYGLETGVVGDQDNDIQSYCCQPLQENLAFQWL